MNPVWQISVGDASEALRPLVFALAALASACVLADARRARLSAWAVAAWTLLTLVCAPVFLPLYLAARLFIPRGNETDESIAGGDVTPGQQLSHQRLSPRLRRLLSRAALPALYAASLLALGGLHFYRDARSADAHLLRASRAKLSDRRERAVAEYRAALALDDDAHTRKLLGLELAEAGRWEEALAEFRQAAARAGRDDDGTHAFHDDTLTFHAARALEATGRGAGAADEYRKFLQGRACAQTPPAPLCEEARARLDALGDAASRR